MTTIQKAENVRDVIRYLQKFKNALVVIYLDDKTIASPLFSSHIRDIALLHEAGLKVVIIPGARTRIDEVLTTSKIEWSYHENIRVSTPDAMPLIKMAAFDVSNTVMTSLAANGITAVIGNWVRGRAKGIINGFDYGTAGEIEKLQEEAIRTVLDDGFIPIFPCIGWNAVGHPYNISSVLLAQQVAIALKADKLFYVIEDGKIMTDNFPVSQIENVAISENGNIAALDLDQVEKLVHYCSNTKEYNCSQFVRLGKDKKIIASNITQKYSNNPEIISILKTAKDACEQGVTRVHLVDGKMDGVLLTEIFSDFGSGTMIYTNNYGKIRPMEQTDIPNVLSVMRPFIESGKLLPRKESDLAVTFGDYIVYEIDGGIHACAALHLYDDNQAEIAAVAVEEAYNHMGIGPKLIENLMNIAKTKNACSIFIMTTQAADWFEKLGFVEDKIESLPEKRRKLWTPSRNSKVYRLKK